MAKTKISVAVAMDVSNIDLIYVCTNKRDDGPRARPLARLVI